MTTLPSASLAFLSAPSGGEGDPPVTVIREMRVKPGHEPEFERLMSLLIAEAIRQPGHLGASVVRPHGPGQGYRFIYKFDRRSHLDSWHRSEARARLFAPVAPLIELDHLDEYPGLETWFDLPRAAAPPKWKTTLLSWMAIYPAVVGLTYLMGAIGFEAPIPVRALVLTAVVVPLVAYVLAPWLGRRLHGWLHAKPVVPAASAPK